MNGTENITGVLRNLGEINLVQVALIVIGAWLLIVLSQRVLTRIADAFAGGTRLVLLATVPVLRLLFITAAVVLVIPRIVEPTFENLVALLGALGLALGFAFKDYISSLIAGIVTLYEMPYRLGDWVEIDGAYGEVTSIGMRAMEIVTPDDTVVVVPHLKLWDRLIYNANDGSTDLLCVTDFYLQPRHDAAQVRQTLHDVALTSAFLQVGKPITVIALEKPWATHYRLKAYPIDPRQQFHFITDLTVRGKAALIDLGVEFAAVPAVIDATDAS